MGYWHIPTITGWWYTYPSEKYDFVSWDDDIPKINGEIVQSCSSHHQPDYVHLGASENGGYSYQWPLESGMLCWWFQLIWKIWLRELGWWLLIIPNDYIMEKYKMFQSTNQIGFGGAPHVQTKPCGWSSTFSPHVVPECTVDEHGKGPGPTGWWLGWGLVYVMNQNNQRPRSLGFGPCFHREKMKKL